MVTVVIPVYKEEPVIERRVDNILQSAYPLEKIEIIVVDSGSNDNTPNIIKNKFPQVKLIQEEQRNGKARAINLALKECKGEIIILTDGPALYERDTISQLVKSFDDPTIGATSALYNIPNQNENRTTVSEGALWSHKDRIRLLESRLSSTSWLSGEACAFRKNVISYVDEDTLADDSNIALQAISKGYRAVITENSHFVEKAPSIAEDYFKVKARRALGGLQEIVRFRSFLFNSRFGNFGLIIFPYRFYTELISPILSLVALTLVIPALIEIGIEYHPFLSLGIGAVLLAAFILLRNKVIAYVSMQLIMLRALMLLLSRKMDVRWVQSKTTRIG